ncbi:FCD domain-containing protein [Pusillimonas sp. TS35]|nr:FCD domain-containing protein [Pusillimonas sp. TS35]
MENRIKNLLKAGPKPARAAAQSTRSIIADLRRRISSQELLPGSRIPEEDLAASYGVPRAKVREVLAVLEDRGLVERIPNKGAVVSSVDMETTYRLYEVREALDTLTVRLAMRNASDDDWQEMANLLGSGFEESLRQGDIATHVAAIMTFRDRLKEIAGNPILSDLIERVYDRTRVTMRRVALLPGRAEMGIHQYRDLLQAMQSGDMAAADRRVQELNESAREYMERYKNYVL